ncbi:6-phospho-beta-glucosidase [Phycicoccus endophyticus]|uniref:6-phospho-beta-glucosidase n=1 Tax=Phycicoccus endophyticus TaxID=1690220 RepID=UPI00140D43AA|nr:6-phospho-beta-glucosidase [Phycicoccus endophyticus]NHI20523.1 6-phospho-beta-glucosidase [Phycicoccus endophyticus]GGL45216.1 6-phospho-beta-glucosidase [Phycicoccus endophyticus]
MRLAMLGGGGFRTPLVYGALLRDRHERRVSEVWLHDVDERRLATVRRVLAELADGHEDAPVVHATTDLDTALEGSEFVFSAVRVGGLEGRVADERVALDLGLLGQETTGPGGLSYGLRTVPVAVDVARRVAALAPDAWVINFTNPAGMITEAMQSVLGPRVVGICDSPIGLARRAAATLGVDPSATRVDYVGLNHLGWLRGLWHEGRDVLPDLIADDGGLAAMEEGRLFGPDWVRSLGMVPNEYLYYYYFTRDAVRSITTAPHTRGEYLLDQQRRFYAAVGGDRRGALAEWDRVRTERNATYMREARDDGEARAEADVHGGGYEGVALAIMAAIARGEPAELILNVPAGGTVPGLPDDAVVEVPCTVDAAGPRPHPLPPLTGHPLGLVQQVKAVERLVIEAALTGSERRAVQAFALHPLVDSVTVARELLTGYRARIPAVEAVFAR